jgi:hypothetical protein
MPLMVRLFVAAAFLIAPLFSFADDLLEPAEYLKILTDSKLAYKFSMEPAKTPVEEMQCPRRDERTRLVVNGQEKSLVDWTVAPEALKLIQEGERASTRNGWPGGRNIRRRSLSIRRRSPRTSSMATRCCSDHATPPRTGQYKKGIALDLRAAGHFLCDRLHAPWPLAEAERAGAAFYPR